MTNEDYLYEHQEPGWSLALIRGECAPLRLCGGSFVPRRKTLIDKEGNTTQTNGNVKCSVLLQRQSSAHITAYGSKTRPVHLDDWLTVHRSITLVDLKLDALNSYLFTHNTFINP